MSSGFGSDDLFENGWASSEPTRQDHGFGSTAYGGSTYLTSSQLLGTDSSTASPAADIDLSDKIPESYREIWAHLQPKLRSVNDLESEIFLPLVNEQHLSDYQTSRIIDVLYDHSLLPPSKESNFFQLLGLVALELDLAGTGDYVTLQFKLNSGLPDFTPEVTDLLLGKAPPSQQSSGKKPGVSVPAESDPLSSHLASTSLDQNTENMLADHSNISIDPDTTAPEVSHVNDFPFITKYVTDLRDKFKPLIGAGDSVSIKEVPEKEGLVFKHINYSITHSLKLGMHSPAGQKRVTRRYSDFAWLLEFLLKKYPFRVIPGLPPKKFTVGASPDSQFLQRRRRGLHRFLNQLVKHPVLVQEPMVITFLSVPTDLASWRKQARVDYSLEFKGQKIETEFVNSIWPTISEEFLNSWKTAEANMPRIIETWTKMVLLVERYEKRQQQIAFDNGKFVEMINRFTELDHVIYPHRDPENKVLNTLNKDDTTSINDSLSSISAFFNKSSTYLIDESYLINTTVLEKFKNFLDYLYSLQELFDRAKKQSVNSIPQLQRKIEESQAKFDRLNENGTDMKGSDIAKLKQAIINDKQEMFQQLNKDWLIKSCCFHEFAMFQETHSKTSSPISMTV
ncbi:hypothetical protein CXQ85_000777 [Candidozyma haemuli]|uniref:Sorting nexin MVP1 n=1 Tax=Candidozyma haemuli TaxID=45357 RepID=A0A2V1AWA0_9ASCO|nr:hypothetical protein CXQ85_000777 [[Candida] haemuloni]PVH21786.1 hypothetical protein CXQ85_000777 [[Candida] haemuloni]